MLISELEWRSDGFNRMTDDAVAYVARGVARMTIWKNGVAGDYDVHVYVDTDPTNERWHWNVCDLLLQCLLYDFIARTQSPRG